ncbi:MAG: Uma2 family endonuclease [Frankiaceae bacterium]
MSVAGARGYYVAADLVVLPDDGQRYEVLDGSLTVTPMASGNHQRVVGNLFRQLARGCPAGWLVLPGAQIDAGVDAPIPDILVVPDDVELPAAFASTAVKLVVEVTSPRQAARDWITKRALYARLGIPLYVIADPGAGLSVLQLRSGQYDLVESGVSVSVPGFGFVVLD